MTEPRIPKSKSLQALVQGYFVSYLMQQRRVSQKTIDSYRDAFKLYFLFLKDAYGINPENVSIEYFGRDYILAFTKYLSEERGCKAKSINQRLTALRSFLRKYVAFEAPEHMGIIALAITVPLMKVDRKALCFITKEEYRALLSACDANRALAERDRLMLSLFYNTGCRVSELTGLMVGDFRNLHETGNASVLFRGKGRKERVTPLWGSTAKNINAFINRNNLTDADALFNTGGGGCLTRSGVGQRISTLAKSASERCPSLLGKNVTPHTFRHSVAMNMLQAGLDISSVAIYLGHESIETTHKYVVSDVEMKRKAFAKVHEVDSIGKRYKASKGILEFLGSI